MEFSYDWAPPPSDQPWVANKSGDCRYAPDPARGGGTVGADGAYVGELILDPTGCIGWNVTGDTYNSYVFRPDFCPSGSP